MNFVAQPGKPYPLGATIATNGVNFALCSRVAQRVQLCVFAPDEKRFEMMRSGEIWHVFLEGARAGLAYGFRVWGEHAPQRGLFANPNKLLLDPYAKKIQGDILLASAEQRAWFHHDDPRDNAHLAPKALCVGDDGFDWENDAPPRHPWSKTLIYEAHVKGLTQLFPDLSTAGSYLALADERVIAHLKALGITAIELLPVHQHLDEWQLQARGLTNYWGYNTLSAFAPEPRYAQNPDDAAFEFKTAVKALHRAGIEVILDVVYNHSAEQDLSGAMLCQRGLDNGLWYWSNLFNELINWSGCGNSIKVDEVAVTRWVLDSLRYWVQEFHVDGFRFDLATILGREGLGGFQPYGKFFHALEQDPILAPCKFIAEPWDLGDYQLGRFSKRFGQWNAQFRDDMRRFWLQHSGQIDLFAQRFAGSDDVFSRHHFRPSHSLNFITAHDGFTLRDLVSYHNKHNHPNGENNHDGHHDNLSFNHGVEGETHDEAILRARHQTQSALLATLILAKGTPMLLAGDELNHTQHGNNNAYCQDNPTTWLNWSDQKFSATIQLLWDLRREIPALAQDDWLDPNTVQWLNTHAQPMQADDWHDHQSASLQILLNGAWLILIHGNQQRQSFTLPSPKPRPQQSALGWHCRFQSAPFSHPSPNTLLVSGAGFWVFHDPHI